MRKEWFNQLCDAHLLIGLCHHDCGPMVKMRVFNCFPSCLSHCGEKLVVEVTSWVHSHSTLHLGEGLRQEPLNALAEHLLTKESGWTDTGATVRCNHRRSLLVWVTGTADGCDLTGLEELTAGVWVQWMRWDKVPEPNSDYSLPAFLFIGIIAVSYSKPVRSHPPAVLIAVCKWFNEGQAFRCNGLNKDHHLSFCKVLLSV